MRGSSSTNLVEAATLEPSPTCRGVARTMADVEVGTTTVPSEPWPRSGVGNLR